jgi:hypothetical protein
LYTFYSFLGLISVVMSLFSGGLVELIVNLVDGFVFALDLQLDLAFFRMQHDRLPAELADHVERPLRYTAQRQLLHVLGNATLDDRAQFWRDGEEPIRRTELVEGLMRTPVIVILDPLPHPLLRLLEAFKLGARDELRMDRFPEPLDLAQGLRVMRAAADVALPHLIGGRTLKETGLRRNAF